MTALIVDDEKVICDGLRTLVERLALPELTTIRTAYRADDALQIVLATDAAADEPPPRTNARTTARTTAGTNAGTNGGER